MDASTETLIDERLRGGPDAPAKGRHALDSLADRFPAGRLDDLRLMVSELVTNAVRHAGAGPEDFIRLTAQRLGDRLRVEVADHGPGFAPRPRRPDADDASGWGLFVVEQLADSWSVDTSKGTLVWFELDYGAADAAANVPREAGKPSERRFPGRVAAVTKLLQAPARV